MTYMLHPTTGLPVGRQLILDTETTGFSPKQGHRIVEIAAMEMIDGAFTGKNYHTYVNPQHPVDPHAEAVHGLSNAFLRSKPTFGQIIEDVVDFFGELTPIWAHNAAFDQRFVAAEFDRAGLTLQHPFECSQKLAKRLPIGTENIQLETLAAHIGYQWGGRGAHSALEDTDALGAVLTKLLWPLAFQHPDDVTKDRQTVRKTKTDKAAATPGKIPRKIAAKEPIRLPEGHLPLSVEADARICRYDDLQTEGLLFARGQKWTRDLEQKLVDAFIDGVDVKSLVIEHGRTPGALLLKLEALGVIAPGHPYSRS